MEIHRSYFYYESVKDDTEVEEAIRAAAEFGDGFEKIYQRLRHDGRTGQDLSWNLLNLISGVSKTENGTTTQLASYNWYADGTKYSAERPDGSGYVYKGNVIYERAANGTLTLDCVLTTGGRIVASKNSSGAITGYTVYHHITDHLGSVRAITDASTGTVVETSDYLPFGTRWSQTSGSSSATITDATNR